MSKIGYLGFVLLAYLLLFKWGMKCAQNFSVFVFLFLLSFTNLVKASSGGSHWGYGDANKEEKNQSYVLVLQQPGWVYEPNYNPFGEDLTEEIRERYKRDFGFSKAQIGLSHMEYFLQHNQTTGARASVEAYLVKQKDFANYVVRRYSERLLDDYMKHNSRLKPAYEVKKRITSLRITETESKSELLFNYNLSGNYMGLKWRHPKYAVDLSVDFISGEVGPTEAQEYTLRLYRKFFTWEVELYHKLYEKKTDLVYTKQITKRLQFQWQANLALQAEETSEQDRRTYLGLTYTY